MDVILRALKTSDSETMFQWINDPEIIQYTNSFKPISEMEHKEWFANTEYFTNNYVFGILFRPDDKLIGTCGLYELDKIAHKAELRIKICESEYRGKGLGTEALRRLIEYGFYEVNLHKIWLRVLANNNNAIELYKRNGFVFEGILREDMFIGGVYHDVNVMSMLSKEFSNGD